MTDPAERFIDAAVRPLADNAELEVAARYELATAIEGAIAEPGDDLESAAARLEAAPHHSSRKWWSVGLLSLVAVASALSLAGLVKDYWKYRVVSYYSLPIGSPLLVGTVGPKITQRDYLALFGHLKPEEKLLLFGDTRRPYRGDRMKPLWESDPENVAYFTVYAVDHYYNHGQFPPNLLQFAHKHDPDNAWFPATAAADAAQAAIDPRGGKPPRSPGGLKMVAIKDQAKLDEAMDLLHEAAKKPRYDSYQSEMLRQRIPLFPKPAEVVDQLLPVGYISDLNNPDVRLRHLADLVSVKAIQLAAAKDREGYLSLLADWEAFTRVYHRAEASRIIDVLIGRSMAHAPSKALYEAAQDLGLTEEAARIQAVNKRFEQWKAARHSHKDPNEKLARRSSLIAGRTMYPMSVQSLRSPKLPDELFTPGRLADHALAGRILSAMSWSLLGLALAATALYRFRGSIVTRRLSVSMERLLKPVDWAWILGIGVAGPVAYHQAICRFTSLGGTDWSLRASKFFVPIGQFSSMLGLIIVLSFLIARHRLGMRAGKVGLAFKGKVWGRLCVLSGAIALPTFGASLSSEGSSEAILIIAACLGGTLWLFALIGSIRSLFSRQSHLLRRVTLSRILMPAYATGMLVMAALIPLFHLEEKHWVARDELMTVSVNSPAIVPFEYTIARLLQQEVLELLDAKP